MNILSAILQIRWNFILSLYICFRSNMSKISWELTPCAEWGGDDPHDSGLDTAHSCMVCIASIAAKKEA